MIDVNEAKVIFLGFQKHNYAGAFTENIDKIILELIESPCLHLFSGTSNIGDVRIDYSRLESTLNCNVFDFIKEDTRNWKWCILDPPYNIKRKETKLKQYSDITSVSASVPKRRALEDFFRKHVENILWLDLCAPKPKGFKRNKLWLCLPGGYRTVRCLSWLININPPRNFKSTNANIFSDNKKIDINKVPAGENPKCPFTVECTFRANGLCYMNSKKRVKYCPKLEVKQ